MKSINSNLTSDSVVRDLPPARAKRTKLTPWFPAHVKPVRVGIYVASVNSQTFYRRWDGAQWYYGGDTLASAAKNEKPWPKDHQIFIRWRGLASNPASKEKS